MIVVIVRSSMVVVYRVSFQESASVPAWCSVSEETDKQRYCLGDSYCPVDLCCL